MYIDRCTTTVNGKSYTRILLRRSVRVGKKVTHPVVANLSDWPPQDIAALELALRHRRTLAALHALDSQLVQLRQGPSIGAVWLLKELAEREGITAALGAGRDGCLALWQVIARTLEHGSRLSAVRLAETHAACAVLETAPFTEDHLYANLAWLADEQAHIEQRLHRRTPPAPFPGVVLYDVTSSYLEGRCNALADWGYNRDGQRGKRHIVIGLLCDTAGRPLSVEVFRGNTADMATVAPQIKRVAERFGAQHVTFVGGRGMITHAQKEDLAAHGISYITALTKPHIEHLLREQRVQLELFDETLHEVYDADNGTRYVLRRNPQRAAELHATREDKWGSVQRAVARGNAYLQAHPRARAEAALRRVQQRVDKLEVTKWVKVALDDRVIRAEIDTGARAREEQLDGCYVLHTNVASRLMDAATVHARYKDLAQVEEAFRTMKTAYLRVRPVYVTREERTRGHVLVTKLSLRLVQALERAWESENMTVAEGLERLSQLCVMEVIVNGKMADWTIPEPRADVKRLLEKAGVKLPKRLAPDGRRVHTKTRLRRNRVSC